MATVDVVNLENKKVGSASLVDALFANEVNRPLIYEVVKAALANQRVGTASTKTRAEVKCSGVKPYRQKGTGQARHGSWVSPIFVGGGITFGPKPRDFRLKVSKKKRDAALGSALSEKLGEKKLVVIDQWVEKKKTKEMVQVLKKLGVGKTLIVLDSPLVWLERTVRNIPAVDVILASQLNAYHVVAHDHLICTKKVAEGFKGA